MGKKNLQGELAERSWKRVSQSKLYHKIEIDAICQNMLRSRPQETCPPTNMGSKNLSGKVDERGWQRASQGKLYHKVESDALCQNMLKIGPNGLAPLQIWDQKTFPEGWPSGVRSERAKENCTIR